MQIFLTGATGFIGSAVVRELLDNGHRVVGLARSDAGAAKLTAAGATVRRGDLDDPDGLRAAAAEADGVVHTAFIHDFTDFAESCAVDLRTVTALGEALVGSDRPLIIASGTAFLADLGRAATEDDDPVESYASPRVASEQALWALAERGVRTSAVRLPPSVHGEGDHGFLFQLIATARRSGFSAYVGDGTTRWPAVHRLDAARVFRLALESAPPASRLHAVADEGVPTREIAEVIGDRAGVPVRSIPAADAVGHFGFLGGLLAADLPASSTQTRKLLGWQPEQPGLIADLAAGHYFG